MNAILQERRRLFLDELAKITRRALPPEARGADMTLRSD